MAKRRTFGAIVVLFMLVAGALFHNAGDVFAHCDTTSGTVIPEAKAALEKGDVTPILKWIKKDDEAQIKAAFAKAVKVRAKGPDEKELADQYFMETLFVLRVCISECDEHRNHLPPAMFVRT